MGRVGAGATGARRLLFWAALLGLVLTLSGCFLAANREINLLVIRTESGGSEVTVTYRMPPPKAGKFYVLWLLNPDLGKTVKVGAVQPSSQLRAVKTRVDFWATGAIVSIESSPEVEEMSVCDDCWALKSGQTELTRGATGGGTPVR